MESCTGWGLELGPRREQKGKGKGEICALEAEGIPGGGLSQAPPALGDAPTCSSVEAGGAGGGGKVGPSRWGCHFPSDNLHIYFNPPLHE